MSGGGKGGSSKVTVGYDYYADFAGVAGLGEASELLEVIIDAQSEWKPATPVRRAESANPYIFNIPSRTASGSGGKAYPGRIYWYWGTADQVLTDPVLSVPGRGHPPYRRRPTMVFENFYCGFERQSVPNIQVVYRRAADQQIVTATLQQGQANPVAVAAELLTNKVTGVGLPVELIDQPSWEALAAELAAEQSTEYLSVILDSAQKLREVMGRLRDYNDIWFRVGRTGKLEAGRVLIGEAPNDLPVLTPDDLTDLPTLEPVTPAEVADRLNLKYTSESHAYQNRIARYDSPMGRIQTDGERDREIALDWITRDAQAGAKVVQLGDQEAAPYWQGNLSIRFARWWDLGLHVGDSFVFYYPPLGFRQVMRAEQISGFSSRGGPVRVQVSSDRRLFPTGAHSVIDATPQEDPPDVEEVTYVHLLQATPDATANNDPYTLVALVGTTQPNVRYTQLWWRSLASEAYVELGAVYNYAVPVRLAATVHAYGPWWDVSGDIKVEQYPTGTPLGFDGLPGTQSSEETLDNNLLLIIIDPTDPSIYEILTVISIESPEGDAYPVHAFRTSLGTMARSFPAGAPAYFAFRRQLQQFASSAFRELAMAATSAEQSVYYKAQAVSPTGSLALDDSAEHALELKLQYPSPVILDGNGAV